MTAETETLVSFSDVKKAVASVAGETGVEIAELTPETNVTELGFDSLDVAALVAELETLVDCPLDAAALTDPLLLKDLVALRASAS